MKITNKLTAILSIILITCICTNANADTVGQNADTRISFSHFYVNDGLSQGTVMSSCQVRGIDIIPELDMPGHMLAAVSNYDGVSYFQRIRRFVTLVTFLAA